MIQLERAQRSVLKTMITKPFKYPTNLLYQDCSVLNVRQLYILKLALKVHRSVITSDGYKDMLNRRNFKLHLPKIRSRFARRFSPYIDSFIYNKVVRACDIRHCSVKEARTKIFSRLTSLNYDTTESILSHLI